MKKVALKSLSVVLPAYNEKENIEICIRSVYKYLKAHYPKFEIIVVNDGSKDNTAAIVTKLKHSISQLRLVSHPKNRGYGATLRTGFAAAKMDRVFYTDSDNQFDISDLRLVEPLAAKYDIVAGYRLKRQDPLMRIVIATVYNIIIWATLGLKIRDVDCSFKLYNRKLLQSLKTISETGLIDAEVLVRARKKGSSIAQVGVRHFPRTLGTTMYEMGNRNKIFAFVRPQVIIDLLHEISVLRRDIAK